MKVKATKTMRKFLADNIPEYSFRIEKMTVDEYKINVDFDVLKHTSDFNGETMQAIKVIYPAEYYAIPAYITTWDLVNAFNNSDGTAAGFLRSVKNEIAI